MKYVPESAFERRLATVRAQLTEHSMDAGVWFDATNIEYLVGFPHVVTERPVVLVVTRERTALLVPRLEAERARAVTCIDAVESYFDYPAAQPMGTLEGLLDRLEVQSVAADSTGPPSVMGYEGPPLSTFADVVEQSWVRERRRGKSEIERSLIRESANWADRVHDELERLVRPGASPVVVSEQAMTAGTEAMVETYGDEYRPRTRFNGPITAGFVSGSETASPHAYTSNDPLQDGDPLITGVVVDIGGYVAELERTMFVGTPSSRHRELFGIMLSAQTKALDAIEPGTQVEAVERAAREHFEAQGVLEHVRHHSGHSIGLELHEPPFLDRGTDAVIRPGDVYAVEPALYVDDGGFRHSDTVVVTEDGAERITTTPRALDANII